MKILSNCIIFLLIHFISSEDDMRNSSVLEMTIYFESYCRFSKQFMQQQLKPIYDDIKHNVTLKFVPFGFAEVSA